MTAKRKFRCGACGVSLDRRNLCRVCRALVESDSAIKPLLAAARKDTARQRRIAVYGARAAQRQPLFDPPAE